MTLRARSIAPAVFLFALLLGSCGSGSSGASHPGDSLGRPIASAAPASTQPPVKPYTAPPTRARNKTSAGLWVVNPDGPLPSDSRWPPLLVVARRFAAADDDYETGRLSTGVRRAIRQTCSPEFAAELLSRPVVLPAGLPSGQVHERAESVGPLEKLPARALVLVSVHRALDGSSSTGTVELTLVESAGRWLVSGLSVLS